MDFGQSEGFKATIYGGKEGGREGTREGGPDF